MIGLARDGPGLNERDPPESSGRSLRDSTLAAGAPVFNAGIDGLAAQFVLDALDQAIWQRKTPDNKALVHHSDRGSQYLSIKYTERLAEAEIDLSVGTVGDAYDNALAECVIGLFKTEVINQIGPWKSMREVEWETLKWVDWYNNRRLLGPIGYIPPAEAEEAFYANLNSLDMVA